MAKAANLVGQKFGKLLVIKRIENNKRGNTMWLCQCDCGNKKEALGYDLTHGRTVSCGCLPVGKPSPNRMDLTGKKFGRLTVVSLCEEKSTGGILMWECKCDCGNTTYVRGSNLKNGHVKSCGCKSKEEQLNRYEDITGKRVGRLIVSKKAGRTKRGVSWLCKCDCGNEKVVCGADLRSGKTKSCGCLSDEARKMPKKVTHGLSRTRIYREYRSMFSRCKPNYHNSNVYYEKGITVCDEWTGNGGFENFYEWAMNNGYSDELSLDRINVNGNYEPSNCRWITMKEQQSNRSDNVFVEYMGETKTLKQWCNELGLSYGMVKARRRNGWTVPELFSPKKKNKYS